MKILVLGVGRQGSLLVNDLTESVDVSEVTVGDLNPQRIEQWLDKERSEKIRVEKIDVRNHRKLMSLMKRGFDVVANALPWSYNVNVANAAIQAHVNYLDLGLSDDVFNLDRKAKAAGVTLIPSCGLDPGIDSVLEGYGARKLQKVEKILMWCGGIPQRNTPAYNNPLRYAITWWWEGAVSTYCGTAKILRDGKVSDVEKLAGPNNPQSILFPQPIGVCEAFYTGAPFLLIQQLNLQNVHEAWSKTVRWPGHCRIWKKLMALNLTSTDLKINIRGFEFTPWEFLVELGEHTLRFQKEDRDVVVQRVHVIGEDTRLSYEFMDFYDQERKVTAMARTTAFPCSIVAQMIARGDIEEKGVIHAGKVGWHPELAERFFSELKKRGIHIQEKALPST